MEISQRDRRALVAGGIGLAMLGAYLIVVEPLLRAYNELADEHQVLAARISRISYENQQAEYLVAQVAKWEAKGIDLASPKPYSEQITAVNEQIIAAGQQSNIKPTLTLSPPKPFPDDPALEMATIRIDAQSEWENLYKFTAALYRIPAVLSVEDIDLVGQGDKLKVTLVISVLAKTTSKNEGIWAK
jgi:Tfp pilus assembly protein PilO